MAAKFTYDTALRLFILNAGVTDLDLKYDFYSAAKRDWKDTPLLNKYLFPIEAIAGQDIGAGQIISPYFQLSGGWKIRPQEADHILAIQGNVITDDASSPFVTTVGAYNVQVRSFITSNSLTQSIGSGVLPQDVTDIAIAVWEETVASHTTAGTFGERIGQKLLTVGKFLGLK